MLASHTLFDHSASGGVSQGGLWLSVLVEYLADINWLHSGIGARHLDHRYPVINSAPFS